MTVHLSALIWPDLYNLQCTLPRFDWLLVFDPFPPVFDFLAKGLFFNDFFCLDFGFLNKLYRLCSDVISCNTKE